MAGDDDPRQEEEECVRRRAAVGGNGASSVGVEALFDRLTMSRESKCAREERRIPVTVLCGVLGAGKTT